MSRLDGAGGDRSLQTGFQLWRLNILIHTWCLWLASCYMSIALEYIHFSLRRLITWNIHWSWLNSTALGTNVLTIRLSSINLLMLTEYSCCWESLGDRRLESSEVAADSTLFLWAWLWLRQALPAYISHLLTHTRTRACTYTLMHTHSCTHMHMHPIFNECGEVWPLRVFPCF